MSIESYPNPNGVLTSLIWRKTMSGAETSLSGYDNASQALSYTPGQEQVYLNGILLVRGDDYLATTGTTITGLSALAASDYVQVNCYNNFSIASVPAQNITGTVTNAQLANSTITINGSAISLGGSTSVPVYSAPTLGSTSIASGATVSNIAGVTINSTTIPTSKTLVATDSTAYVVPAVSVATTLNTYTAFSQIPYGGQQLNPGSSLFYLAPYGSFTSGDLAIFNAAFPVGSVVTATDATQTGTFTITQAATINGGGYIIANNITTSAPSTIFFTGAVTLSRGTSTSGKYLTNNGSTSSWATLSSGGMTLLSTTTLSGATTTISSINQTYKNLRILIYNISNSTADGNFTIKHNGYSDSQYITQMESGTFYVKVNSFYSTGIAVARADVNNSWDITIGNYASTSAGFKPVNGAVVYIGTGNAQKSGNVSGGFYAGGVAITSLAFANTGGNWATGTVEIYGVN